MSNGWQSISVEVVYPTKGKAIPRTFTWDDIRLRICDIGRSWEADDGCHRLVRVQDGRTFELVEHAGIWQACVRATPPSAV